MTPRQSRSMVIAMVCAGAITAQFVGGKATRDALFLGALNYTALPTMLIVTSAFSILAVAVNARLARLIAPSTLVPVAFGVSGVLFLVEWLFAGRARAVVAVVVYLHISGIGPILGSGFWLVMSEQFDPHTAKREYGRITGAGTIGGLVSAVLAERVGALLGAAAMLPFLAVFHLASGWLVRQLSNEMATNGTAAAAARANPPTAEGLSGWGMVVRSPYLRTLALLVLFGTTSAALVDYLFKAGAVAAFGRGDDLLRFFAVFYAGISLVSLVVQTSLSRRVLERFGLAVATSTPSLAVAVGGLGGLALPGFGAMLAIRGAESVLRSSLFRAGYEIFYTPMAPPEKRAAKSIVDVGVDRLGDAVGGGLVRAGVALAPAAQSQAILALGILCSAAAMLSARRLTRGYVKTLERSLLDHAVDLDLSDVVDGTTRTLIIRTLGLTGARPLTQPEAARKPAGTPDDTASRADPIVRAVQALRSRDRTRVVDALRAGPVSPALVPHIIPLLAWDAVAGDATAALCTIAEQNIGQLTDALLDRGQDFAVRRRLATVFSVCNSQRAVDGLVIGLDDSRFEVRCRCGRALTKVIARNPQLRLDHDRILAVVLREVTVGRPIWESRRLLDDAEPLDAESFLDDFVRVRAGQSLAHVFTLLALVLPAEPLRIAFRSLQTDDRYLQGTALEYLEEVLPDSVRPRLWPYLEDRRTGPRRSRPRDEIVAELLRSNRSIELNLEELRRKTARPSPPASGPRG